MNMSCNNTNNNTNNNNNNNKWHTPTFSKNPEDFINNMNKLPQDIIKWCITPYVPSKILMTTCRGHYAKNHKLKNIVGVQKTESYIRAVVRKDMNFVLRTLLEEIYNKWLNMTHWLHNHTYYSNYIDFLQDFCIEHESDKCLEEITNMRLSYV